MLSYALVKFRDEYAPGVDLDDPKLTIILIEKIIELRREVGEESEKRIN